jgi:hypothetical protein
MPQFKKYAIRITERNLALISVLHPIAPVDVKEDTNWFFVFTVDGPMTTTQHDVVQEDDLKIYDGNDTTERVTLN